MFASRTGMMGSSGSARIFLGDIESPSHGYSLRTLSSSFSSSDIILVRRSSDSSTLGFTETEISDGTLEAWVGVGNDGYVATWYDQFGSEDLSQYGSCISYIVDSGSLVTHPDTGKPAIYQSGLANEGLLKSSGSYDLDGDGATFVVNKPNPSGSDNAIYGGWAMCGARIGIGRLHYKFNYNQEGFDFSNPPSSALVRAGVVSSGVGYTYEDLSLLGSSALSTGGSFLPINVGGRNVNNGHTESTEQYVSEVLFWFNSAPSATTSIISNQLDYWT